MLSEKKNYCLGIMFISRQQKRIGKRPPNHFNHYNTIDDDGIMIIISEAAVNNVSICWCIICIKFYYNSASEYMRIKQKGVMRR